MLRAFLCPACSFPLDLTSPLRTDADQALLIACASCRSWVRWSPPRNRRSLLSPGWYL